MSDKNAGRTNLIYLPCCFGEFSDCKDGGKGCIHKKACIEKESLIPLENIDYDPMARNGTWCRSVYPGHPRGCPNFPRCIQKRPDFRDIAGMYRWFAVVETFDLKAHSERMKIKHPGWSDRQCRNPLYWQGTVRANLRNKALLLEGDILLDIPEACGINVFETMARVGVILEKKPDIVRKVMIVGRKVSR